MTPLLLFTNMADAFFNSLFQGLPTIDADHDSSHVLESHRIYVKKHVQAMLWKLARVMIQDLWGRYAVEESLYDHISVEPGVSAPVDLDALQPVTPEEVRSREQEFVRRGKGMKLYGQGAPRVMPTATLTLWPWRSQPYTGLFT